jgi:hypothetical protein
MPMPLPTAQVPIIPPTAMLASNQKIQIASVLTGTRFVIPGRSNRKKRNRYDKQAYKGRNVIEIDQS